MVRMTLALLLLCNLALAQAADTFKPFILAATVKGDMAVHIAKVKGSLRAQGFSVAGEYGPYDGAHVIVLTNAELQRIAGLTERGAYAAGQRVALTRAGDEIQISYVNPLYLQHAYRLGSDMSAIAKALERALGKQESFGAKGLTARKLNRFHYSFGMEYFDDPYALVSYKTHQAALAALEQGLAKGQYGVTKIYRIDIPGTQTSVFGVAMKAGSKADRFMDDAFQMREVDYRDLRSTAYLPYEILVRGRRVEALHMRFRMAVHFPDLKMMGEHSFMGLIQSPDAIKDVLTLTAGGTVEEEDEI